MTVLVLFVLAKLCGQDQVSGIAEWVQHRGKQLIELLKLSRKTMPHHSTYRRIMADIIDAMAYFNNLILGVLLAKQKYHYIPSARRYLDAHPKEAIIHISRL